MANVDKLSIGEVDYDVVSPVTVNTTVETIGASCAKSGGYTAGEYFLAKNSDVQYMYKATATIAVGDTITVNTNCVKTDINTELKNLDDNKQDKMQYNSMPTASANYADKIIQYVGTSTQTYARGQFYACEQSGGSYVWTPVSGGSGDSIQYNSMPTASADWLGKIIQYVGATTSTYTKGYFYVCVENGGVYSWAISPTGVSGDSIQYSTMPTASAEFAGKIVQYIGATNVNYTNGYFYECVNNNGRYSWVSKKVQEADKIQFVVMPTASAALVDSVFQYIGQSGDIYICGEFYKCIETEIPPEQEGDNPTYVYSWESLKTITQLDVLPTASEAWLGRIVQFTGTSPYTNGYYYKCVNNNGQYEWIEWSVMRTGTTPAVVDVSGASVEREFRVATIRWTDPEDSEISGQVIAQWGGTKVVRKVGSAPQNEEDGTLIINSTTRDAYSQDGLVDNTLEYGKVYYYRFFPYTTINVITKGTAIMVNCTRTLVPLPAQTGTLYYNNTTQQPTLTSETGITKSGQTSGKNAGSYTMTLSLVSDDYRWADGTTADKTITWSIQKAKATITPSKSSVSLGRHSGSKSISFSDLYDRTITTVTSSDTDVCTVTTDGEDVSIAYAGLGDATVTVTTNSTDNSLQATATISVECIFQVIYGFQIDGDESDPDTMVSYLVDSDNYNYTPAHMNFSTGEFDWGSWQKDEFFIPKPCMLRYDGTVAYYLDEDDYSKKADGVTPSDVADSSFGGNAMMEWGRNGDRIWYKVAPYNSGKSAKIYIANYQVDSGYHDWSFHNCDSVSVDHFYTPIYNGSQIDGKLRSISGKQVSKSLTGTQEISYAKANNPGTKEMWNIECLADRMLINFLLVLMGKSCDTQTVFGMGACSGGSESVNDTFRTGVHNDKGLFYGTNSGSTSSSSFNNVVKVFGMENYWGLTWRRLQGLVYNETINKYLIKLSYGQEDSSTADGYNATASGYIELGFGITGENFVSQMTFNDFGMFASNTNGSSSTYYCDKSFSGNHYGSGMILALVGGRSNSGNDSGAFEQYLSSGIDNISWSETSAISCRPLKED